MRVHELQPPNAATPPARDGAALPVVMPDPQGGWAALLASAQDAIVVHSVQGLVTAWNPAAERLLGWSAHEAVGCCLLQLTVPAEHAEEARRVQQALQQGRDVAPFRTRRLNRHGGLVEVSVAAAPLRDAQGQVTGAMTTLRDRRGPRPGDAEFDAAVERRVQERTAALGAILNSAASAIITTDLKGRITSFNPAAEAMFRMAEAQALGRLITDISDQEQAHAPAPHSRPDGGAGTPRDTAAAGGGRRGERIYLRADGTRFPGLLSISMLRDEVGTVQGILCIVTDLTERKQMEEALRERTVQAEAANRAKSAFLAHMSHEIRTPLNAVIGLSQLLARMELPARAQEFVRHIGEAGTQLLGLTDDVLDLSRIEAGALHLEHTRFELLPLLESVCDLVAPQAGQKGLALRFEPAPELPSSVLGDPVRLRQVLLNLLGNAVKFTAEGSVTLRAAQLRREGGHSTLGLEVADTGIGIAPEHQRRIFEPFTQAEGYTTRRFGGSGLGLSIVHRLVQLMGGSVRLHSTPGQGSTFTVTVSLALP
ncbi:PAS domain-containing sensor histidine kinase [Azohydromonas caseinilytica]|uniref:Virulence sensor protein BvgS n=1 Tax=Azohydromonas caseinilytica TaxID=2728836 RepID=A0A848F9A9_9BURK|nr:PAS domain S-box protein [Azohydromonas caseinilytica]NML16124.1 PAS domain S-box protein [Azohydromonas caseinilytica]